MRLRDKNIDLKQHGSTRVSMLRQGWRTLVLGNGLAGTETQCLGIAEHLPFPYWVARVPPQPLYAQLPTTLQLSLPVVLGNPFYGFKSNVLTEQLLPPWCSATATVDAFGDDFMHMAFGNDAYIIVGAGRQTVPLAVALTSTMRRLGISCRSVFLQNPRAASHHFDLLFIPNHDKASVGKNLENVHWTRGAPHRVNVSRLGEATESAGADLLKTLPRPLHVFLVGAPHARCRYRDADVVRVARQIASNVEDSGGSLCVIASRRTTLTTVRQLDNCLSDVLTPENRFLWSDATTAAPNPYMAALALADSLHVTADSISMISEAASVANDRRCWVCLWEFAEGKFARFLNAACPDNNAATWRRPLAGFDDTPRVADTILRTL